MVDRNQIEWFIHTLTGSVDTVVDWRCIHDQRRDLPAHNYRGTIAEMLPTLEKYNADGYGVFCNINAMDGQGRNLENVQHIRSHVIDLDSLSAPADFDRATAAGASFVVQTSPDKFHVYFRVEHYQGNEFYTLQQRKLAQLYNGDPKVIDPTRIIRTPGFDHCKGEPTPVIGWQLPNFEKYWSADEIAQHLASVNIVEHFSTRSKLGEPEMSAPSLDWLKFALTLVAPGDMDYGEWVSFTAAVKQAGWLHADEPTLYAAWLEWCAQYEENDEGENLKIWNSIKDTEIGWKSIERRTAVKAYMMFGHKEPPEEQRDVKGIEGHEQPAGATPAVPTNDFGEILSHYECKEYFKDCYFVEQSGKIFVKSGRYMKSNQFNGRYGGKQFIITSTGKLTDEPWKAALRSTCWTIPKVDHLRFLPEKPKFKIVYDALERPGLNTYIPATIDAREGDVSLWLDHVTRILPLQSDRDILMSYLAHCVKFPGYKIPWAPLLQSAEGIGKNVFFEVMQHTLGSMYIYSPSAPELAKSGNKFNAWMSRKLLIMVNEIRVDERRELIEILKPMISDKEVEVQSKGVDQDMEDNPANWLFFSNFKDAIPVYINGRRYAIFYSILQSELDIINAGMDEVYFTRLFEWLRDGGGFQAVAYWLLNYPIERGGVPMRAPRTSSHAEALAISRSPMELIIAECVADGLAGFRGGYVSTLAVIMRSKAAGIRSPNTRTVQTCLEKMGYTAIGRAVRPYIQEDVNNRAEVYGALATLTLEGYGPAQGYE